MPHPTYLRRPGATNVLALTGLARIYARTHICTPPSPPTMQAHARTHARTRVRPRTARRTCAQTRGRARRARPPRLPCRSRGASAKHERSACDARHAADRTRPCDTRGLDGRCCVRVGAVCARACACGPHVCVWATVSVLSGGFDGSWMVAGGRVYTA